ncbi:hypothetical protein ACN47A_10705 [Myxococcus fulvus]|uniref:hypothetical protein n=1 Tax=Myxococcus fulvus TaxID=33 RepID=UPI003B9CE638
MALMLLLAGSASRAAETPLPLVDLGVRDFRIEGSVIFSRRTDGDWWALSFHRIENADELEARARVLRSADAGRTWREDPEAGSAIRSISTRENSGLPRFEFFVWYTPEVGIIVGNLGARVLRTTDGGRSWTSIKLSQKVSFQGLSRVGARTWLCGEANKLFRSDTQGARWEELPNFPFHQGPSRCQSLSFRDESHGWALGRTALWATDDGGVSWRKLEPPAQPLVQLDWGEVTQPWLHQTLLLSAKVGWVLGTGGRFQTTDGGRTWQERPLTPEQSKPPLGVATLKSGRSIITVGSVSPDVPLEQWIPALEPVTTLMGTDTVISFERADRRRNSFTLDAAGRRLRTAPLLSQGAGSTKPLSGIFEQSPERWFGWTPRKVLVSHDQGKTWFVRGGIPSTAFPIQELYLNTLMGERLLARTANATWESRDEGFTWSRTDTGIDGPDHAARQGLSLKEMRLISTPRCLLLAPDSILKVQFGIEGDGHRGSGRLELIQRARHLSASGQHESSDSQSIQVPPRRYSRSDGERLLREFVDTATRPERPVECDDAKLRHIVTLEWTCGVEEPVWHRVDFQSPICPEDLLYQPPNSFTDGEPEDAPSMRARSLHHAAYRLLHDARP